MGKIKKRYIIPLMSLIFCLSSVVFASSDKSNEIPIAIAIFMEAFVTMHMSVFVLKPLSMIISVENSKEVFWKMFLVRISILLFFDFIVTTKIAIVDFFCVFIGAFVIVPIVGAVVGKKNSNINGGVSKVVTNFENNNLSSEQIKEKICPKCGSILMPQSKFCSNCGEKIVENIETPVQKELLMYTNFDQVYRGTDEEVLEKFILKELKNADLDLNTTFITQEALKRKKVLNVIFSVLVFVYISLIFFHFPIYTYLIGAIVLVICSKLTKSYSLMKYIKKEVKSRPGERISNIVMNTKLSMVKDETKRSKPVLIAISVLIAVIIFFSPRIMYEKSDNGYAVRFYTFGITNFTNASIPSSYKGENVVELRGNTFSNMPFLKSVTLPNTINSIRGQAFKNDISLKEVNLPNSLEYLGGGAFYNCKALTSISLPDSLTYMGGETFYGASSLENVKLSNRLSEIRGNTFENCKSLKIIEVPNSITRIAAHSFYGCDLLENVKFEKESQLKEIGSSAFRLCKSLRYITLPRGVNVSSKAFKDSPTLVRYFE